MQPEQRVFHRYYKYYNSPLKYSMAAIVSLWVRNNKKKQNKQPPTKIVDSI